MPSPATILQRKQKMSLSQTYYLAHTARGKLSKEAARADHDLRLLVGHANLLDGLMEDLADAEREQESWFNETVRRAASAKDSEQPKHITWADNLPAVAEAYDAEEEESSDDEAEDVEFELPPVRASAAATVVTTTQMELDSDSDDDEDVEELQLTRTPSRSSPPELLHEEASSDSDESEDDMPPSPPSVQVQPPRQSAKPSQSLADEAFYQDGFYLPQRQVVAAY